MQKALFKKPINKLYTGTKEWSKSRTARKKTRVVMKIDRKDIDMFDVDETIFMRGSDDTFSPQFFNDVR